jgi:hypothetical protein
LERRFLVREQMTEFVRDAFGSSGRLLAITRLAGGSKKGVYRLALDGDESAVLYVWSADENYWPDGDDAATDPFADASGADLFEAGRAEFDALGVRTPRLLFMDRSRRRHPADLALVEDVRGGTLEALIERDPRAADEPLALLGAALRLMARRQSPGFGKVALVANGKAPQDRRPERIALERALRHLTIVSERVERIASARTRIEERLRVLAAAVRPRDSYALIHGELGPDHVLIDRRGRPVLIDIEGAMFFDLEWEHAFAKLRFGRHFAKLEPPDLDGARMAFYQLAQSLSLIEGPLRIADGDFPDRDFMVGIAEWHINAVLAAVMSGS